MFANTVKNLSLKYLLCHKFNESNSSVANRINTEVRDHAYCSEQLMGGTKLQQCFYKLPFHHTHLQIAQIRTFSPSSLQEILLEWQPDDVAKNSYCTRRFLIR